MRKIYVGLAQGTVLQSFQYFMFFTHGPYLMSPILYYIHQGIKAVVLNLYGVAL